MELTINCMYEEYKKSVYFDRKPVAKDVKITKKFQYRNHDDVSHYLYEHPVNPNVLIC